MATPTPHHDQRGAGHRRLVQAFTGLDASLPACASEEVCTSGNLVNASCYVNASRVFPVRRNRSVCPRVTMCECVLPRVLVCGVHVVVVQQRCGGCWW